MVLEIVNTILNGCFQLLNKHLDLIECLATIRASKAASRMYSASVRLAFLLRWRSFSSSGFENFTVTDFVRRFRVLTCGLPLGFDLLVFLLFIIVFFTLLLIFNLAFHNLRPSGADCLHLQGGARFSGAMAARPTFFGIPKVAYQSEDIADTP